MIMQPNCSGDDMNAVCVCKRVCACVCAHVHTHMCMCTCPHTHATGYTPSQACVSNVGQLITCAGTKRNQQTSQPRLRPHPHTTNYMYKEVWLWGVGRCEKEGCGLQKEGNTYVCTGNNIWCHITKYGQTPVEYIDKHSIAL